MAASFTPHRTGLLLALIVIFLAAVLLNVGSDKDSNVEVQLLSAASAITRAAPAGVYRLIGPDGSETELPAAELLQNGLYFKHRTSGEIYHTSYDESPCSDMIRMNLKKIENVRSDEFAVYARHEGYARDAKQVYFVTPYYLILKEQELACEDNYEFLRVADADPDSFVPDMQTLFDISRGNLHLGIYARDAKKIFFGVDAVPGADPESFRLTEDVPVTNDKNHVYFWNKIIPEADPASYTVVKNLGAATAGTVYGKDKNHVYIDYCQLQDVDLETFRFISRAYREFEDELADKYGPFRVRADKRFFIQPGSCPVVRMDISK